MTIRQPIVTVAGHVDHGKTSILDSIRLTGVQEKEAGGITQKISFTKVPIENIKKRCPLIEKQKIKLDFPGFLFIDTPGHAAFSNLRKRGGSLADLAILVIDINEGIMPQTIEVIEILKLNKTPFLIALNKIDNISGWQKLSDDLKENIEMQSINTRMEFDEKLLTLEGSLHHHGFNAKPYYEITDFTTQLALVPCSAKKGYGINELIMMLCGLSQKFLTQNLKLGKEARGVILEIKKEKSIEYTEAILYDGVLNAKNEIAIGSFDKPIISKIRILEEVLPVSSKFKPVANVQAAQGIRMHLINSQDILPGMPFMVFKNNLSEIEKQFKKEIGEKVQTDKKGIIIKADSLGSLEALIILLKQEHIQILKAGIGKINKTDIINCNANLETDPENAVILGFNTSEDEEVKSLDISKIKIIKQDVIYKLIEDLIEFKKKNKEKTEKEKLMSLASLCKLKILHQYVFHNAKPAIFGVSVEAGKLKENTNLIDEQGDEIGKVKRMQKDKETIEQATQEQEVAISVPGITFDRQLSDKNYLYSDLSEYQFREFKKNKELLTTDEIQTMQKIAQIKRAVKPTWGV